MNRESVFPVFLVFVVIGLILFMFIVGSSASENQRIYQKCLDNNGHMVYNEVVKLCKEMVK